MFDAFLKRPSWRFLLYLSCFLAGVALAAVWHFASVPFLLSGVVLCLSAWFIKDCRRRFVVWLALALVIGGWRMALAEELYQGRYLDTGKAYRFGGQVCREPAEKLKYQEWELCLADGRRILVLSEKFPSLEYGTSVSFICRLADDRNRSAQLKVRGLSGLCAFPRLESGERKSLGWRSELVVLRQRLARVISAGMAEPEAGLTSAMILGYQNLLDRDTSNDFAQTGTSHLISIGGLHMGIIIGFFVWLLIFSGLKRSVAYWLSVPAIIIYLFLIGAPAAAARSVVMAVAMLVAFFYGRLAETKNTLFLAAAVLVFINPFVLLGDLSFQLSFLSLAAIVYGAAPLADWLLVLNGHGSAAKSGRWLAVGLATTVAAQLATWPLTGKIFGQMSLVAPLSNLLVVPMSPALLAAAIIGLVLSLAGAPALWAFAPATFLAWMMISVVKFFARLPMAAIAVGVFPDWAIAGYYLLILASLVYMKFRQKTGVEYQR